MKLTARFFTCLSLILAATITAVSQQKFTVSGKITDEESGEVLIGATIYSTKYEKGIATNTYGYYSLTLPQSDSLSLIISYLGHAPQIRHISLTKNVILSVELLPSDISLDEIIVDASRGDQNVQSTQLAQISVPVQKIKELPVLLGETDVFKVIQLLPGVLRGNEGTTGFHVRGGNTDQNLVLLDEAVVYNPNHLLGLFSTFNSRALNNVTLIKGGFPAQYGGRLSSILDITMRDGNNKRYQVEGGLGLITSTLTVEGPIKEEKASFILSGRRTYIDLLLKEFLPPGNKSNYSFYDLNGKINWKISDKDHVFLSAFKGNDDAEYKASQGINYKINLGNAAGSFRWNHIFGPKLFTNTSLVLNEYNQDISAIQDSFFSQTVLGINDVNGKTEFQYFPSPQHSVRFGGQFTQHKFVSGGKTESLIAGNQAISANNFAPKYFNESAIYLNDDWKISDALSMNLGLRSSFYFAKNTSYNKLEPRASIKYSLSQTSSIKAAYSLMNQYLHLIPSSTATVPTDVWVPSTQRTKPQMSIQYALGYFRNFQDNDWEASVEFYYKDMDNQVLFPEGNQIVENFDIDSTLVYGKGWSYGMEVFVKKNYGDFTGWLAYTLSWTYQQFDDLNFGQKFPFRNDRRHVLSAVGSYPLNHRWKASGAFVFNTGSAYTVPMGRFNSFYGPSLFEGNYFIYQERNNARMESYHRLDLSLTYTAKGRLFGRPLHQEMVLGLYNVYSRLNPYFVYFEVDPATEEPTAYQVTLLPIVPSITYNFKF